MRVEFDHDDDEECEEPDHDELERDEPAREELEDPPNELRCPPPLWLEE